MVIREYYSKIHFAVLLIFICGMIFSCKKENNLKLPEPIASLSIGMSQKQAEEAISELQINGVMSNSNELKIGGETVRIQFIYCKYCFGHKLNGVVISTNNRNKLDSLIQLSAQKNLNIEWHIIENSYDLLPNKSPNIALCLYSNDVDYDPNFKSLMCKKKDSDPCW